MAYYRAVIEVLIDVQDEGEACDAIAEAVRPMLKQYADDPSATCWIDWHYAPTHPLPTQHDGTGFEYADAVYGSTRA